MADRLAAVDDLTLGVAGDKALVAGVFHETGDPVEGPVPALLFPAVAHGGPVEDLAKPVLVGLGEIEEACALGAERPLVNGVFGVPFDVEDLSRVFVDAADLSAAHGAVTADRSDLPCRHHALHLVDLGGVSLRRAQIDAQGGQRNPRSQGA